MRPKSTDLAQMAGSGLGKRRVRASVTDWFNPLSSLEGDP